MIVSKPENPYTLPKSEDIERAVLGAIILESECLVSIVTELDTKLFYHDYTNLICKAILELYQKKGKIDGLTVCQQLKANGDFETVGGGRGVMALTDNIATALNIQTYVRLLQEMYLKRETVVLCKKTIANAMEHGADAFHVVGELVSKLENTQNKLITKDFETIGSMANDYLQELEAKRSGTVTQGIGFGLEKIDRYYQMNPTDLVILAARPAMGKTALILKVARNAAINLNKPVGFFSLEMSSKQLLQRIASAECLINSELLHNGKGLTDENINTVYRKLKDLTQTKLFIDDTGGLNIHDLRNRAKKLVSENKVELIIVDYLQLITANEFKNDKTNQISFISGKLKQLAKEINVPVIALSQLSRSVDSRPKGEKLPRLSDLRDSGAIEQDADAVIFICRPEYYKEDSIDLGMEQISSKGKAIIDIAKNRHGSLLTDIFNFEGQYTDFYD